MAGMRATLWKCGVKCKSTGPGQLFFPELGFLKFAGWVLTPIFYFKISLLLLALCLEKLIFHHVVYKQSGW